MLEGAGWCLRVGKVLVVWGEVGWCRRRILEMVNNLVECWKGRGFGVEGVGSCWRCSF